MIEDKNGIPELIENIRGLGQYACEVGIFAEQDSEYAMIATVHEFGVEIKVTPKMRAYLHSQGLHLKKGTTVIKIPERSFIRNGLGKFDAIMPGIVERALDDMFEGTLRPMGVYERLGVAAENAIKRAMVERKEPALHPFTVSRRRKRSNQPLVDEGGLMQRVTHMTVARGGA